jgi:hypothetical protein
VEIEFLDPGPNQPDGPGEPALVAPIPPQRRVPRLDRETIGLLVMLTAAAVLPVVASFQLVFLVHADFSGGFTYGADGWGRFRLGDGSGVVAGPHEPRFGVLLAVCGAAFAALALIVAAQALLRVAPDRRASGAAVAGAAGVLVGLLVGVTASMALEVQAVVDRLRSSPAESFDGVSGFRLQVGAAVWLSLAGVLAGGLAVAAALRRHRSGRLPHSAITIADAGY